MKLTVLNGSPKGNSSVTLQYVLYMQKNFPHINMSIHHVAQKIQKLEKDEHSFQQILDDIASSDAVLWAFPLYFYLVSAQYKRFIELIFERGMETAFRNKYAASLSTSVHFFDHTAHNYIHAVCDDLDMRYVADYSARMYDLMKKEERQRFLHFVRNFHNAVQRHAPAVISYLPLQRNSWTYTPEDVQSSIDTPGKKILILTDDEHENGNLTKMVRNLKRHYLQDVEEINLHHVNISGGCLGCISCGYDNQCVYFGKDGYRDFFEAKVKTADALVIAGAMKDRYLSSRWKLFFDRSFYNTHQPVLNSKQVSFLISGPLAQNHNLRQILTAYTECMGANLAGFVTDESGDSAVMDAQLHDFALRISILLSQNYLKPATFLGVGGRLIFRDAIWGSLRFAFLGDHRYYKKHGFYIFPQKNYKMRIRNLMMTILMNIPATRKSIVKRFKEEMIKPLQHVIAKEE